MSWIVKVGKQGKKIVKKLITPAEKHYVGYTRRIERVQTTRRICAMTFDDGPMGLPASPDRFDGRDEPLFDRLTALAEQRAIVFADNRLRLDDPMTVGELAMLLAPKAEAITRRVAQLRQTGRAGAYDGAMAWCRENGLISEAAHPADHVTALPETWFVPTDSFTRRDVYAALRMERL